LIPEGSQGGPPPSDDSLDDTLATVDSVPREHLLEAALASHGDRARVGIVITPPVVATLGFLAGTFERWPAPFAAAVLGALVCAGLRLWLLAHVKLRRSRRRSWNLAYRLSSAGSHALIGGMAGAIVAGSPEATPLSILALAAMVVVATVVAYSHTIGLGLTLTLMAFDIVPCTLLLYQRLTGDDRLGLLVAMVGAAGYLAAIAVAEHRRLWKPLEHAYLARQRALALGRTQSALDRLRANLELQVEERTAELSHATTQYRTIFENVHDAVLLFEPQGERILKANRRASEVYGIPAHEMVGMSLIDVSVHPEAGAREVERTLRAGTLNSFETRQRRRDGSVMTLAINASVIELDGKQLILSINRDVTEEKKLAELRLAKEAAERADRAKGQFLAHMSHEIRTPMSGALGLLELLSRTPLSDEQRRLAELAQSSTESLLRVIDDILDYSRIEAGRLTLEDATFDLPAALAAVGELLSFAAKGRGIELRLDLSGALPRWVVGDAGRLRQILINLLGNAVKFTDHGAVTLWVSPTASGERIFFEVADTGRGISEEQLGRLFQPFSQGDPSMARRHGGSGLGLVIAQRLVQAMGGEIRVVSRLSEGSRFSFSLALRRGTAPVADAAASTEKGTAYRVLVAEDDPINRLVVERMLARLGHRVTAVANGVEALGVLDTAPVDLILMDCQMPELDGFEATRRIRALPDGRARIPIIAATAHAMTGDRERCLDAGMTDYVSKPYREQDLADAIARCAARCADAEPGTGPAIGPAS
jgi:PAS domain S-box-containing protein